jgi:autotransporter-associated beta strand protein
MICRKGLLVLGVLILGALDARAQTTLWAPTVGQNWNNSSNWSNGVPSSSNMAQFDSAGTSTVDVNFTVNDLVLESASNIMIGTSGGALTVTGGTSDTSADDNGISANIAGAGTMSLSGGAILLLSGTNTYTGVTTVTSGTLRAGSTTAFGPMSEVTIGGSGVLDLANYNNTIYSLSGSGSVTLGTGVGGTLTVGGGLGPFINTTFSGVISGTGGLTYNTYGQSLTLTGANTYSGTTTITQGTLEIGNNGTTGSIGSGPIATVVNGYIEFARSDSNTYSNVISGSGSVAVMNGTVTLNGLNTYSEFTDVTSGTLIVGAAYTGSSGALGNGGTTVNLTSGSNPAILNLNNLNTKIGEINGDSTSQLQLGSATLTIQNIAGTNNMGGTITGTGSMVMIVGTFNATGNANTYSGGTTINGGTFVALNTLSTSSATGSGPITINGGGGSFLSIGNDTASGYLANVGISDNGVIQFARTDSTTFPNTISGTGSIDVQDGGTVTLTGANSYSGDTAIDLATLKAGSSTALGSGTALSFNYSGGTLDLNGNNISVGSVTGGSNMYPSYINLGSNTLTIGGIPGTTSLSTIISGTGGIALTGPATETTYLTAIDTYSGSTVIGTGAILGLGFSSLAGSIPDTSGISGAGTLLFYEPSATTVSAPITGSLGVTQSSAGAGVVTLSGTNTYTGATTINSGTLEAGSTSAFGNASPVTINGTGELNLNGFNNTIGPLAGSATSTIVLGGATLTVDPPADPTFSGVISGGTLALTGPGTEILDGANTSLTAISIGGTSILQVGDGATAGASISGNVTDNGALVFEPYSTDNITYAGAISGPGTVTFSGTGQINFSGANMYSGQTSLQSGTLTDSAANSYSPSSVMAVSSGAHLQVNHDETILGLQNGTGGGNVAIASGAVLDSAGGGAGDFGGIISGIGSILVSAGVQGFTGNNSYSGGTTITNDGEIFVGSNNALGTGTITFEGSGPELSPDASVTLSNPIVLNATFDNDDGASYNLTLTGPISGGSEIEWCAPGTLTLANGTNSFSGGIDMRVGALVVTTNGATGSGTITLDSSTTLDAGSGVTVSNPLNFTGTAAVLTGPGTIATPVTVDGTAIVAPALSPGGGPANLTFSNGLTFANGGTVDFGVYNATGSAGVGYSLITVPTGLSFSASPGGLTFNLNSVTSSGSPANAINFNPSSSYAWMFATSSSTITGFSASDFNLVTSGFSNGTAGGTFSLSEVGDNLFLNFTPVPEPSTWALMGAGLVALLVPFAMRRRRLARI